jgi:hypothetical protein
MSDHDFFKGSLEKDTESIEVGENQMYKQAAMITDLYDALFIVCRYHT